MSKIKFSISRHKEIGAKLKDIHHEVSEIKVAVYNAYNSTTKANKIAAKAQAAISELRCELEAQFSRDYPAESGQDEWKGIYYGGATE